MLQSYREQIHEKLKRVAQPYDPSERTQTAFGKKRKNRKREEEEEFGIILGSFSASGGQMGLIRFFRQSGSKSMCFISQSGRDPLFRCRVANLTCKKPCKTHEKREGAPWHTPTAPTSGSLEKPPGTLSASTVWVIKHKKDV